LITVLLAYLLLVGLAACALLMISGRTIDRLALFVALGLCVALNPARAAYSSAWRAASAAERQARGDRAGAATGDSGLVYRDYLVFSMVTLAGRPVMLGALDRIVVLAAR
jgi:hypothetical protein